MKRQQLITSLLAAAVMLTVVPTARAQESKAEIGTSLMGVTVGTGDNDATVVGVPSSSFGPVNPSLHASIFLGSRFAVEPQLGLIWVSTNRASRHFLHVAAQIDYVVMGTERASPCVFASVGIVDVSASTTKPKNRWWRRWLSNKGR